MADVTKPKGLAVFFSLQKEKKERLQRDLTGTTANGIYNDLHMFFALTFISPSFIMLHILGPCIEDRSVNLILC